MPAANPPGLEQPALERSRVQPTLEPGRICLWHGLCDGVHPQVPRCEERAQQKLRRCSRMRLERSRLMKISAVEYNQPAKISRMCALELG